MLRKSLGFIATVAVALFVGYQLAWHWRSDIWPELEGKVWQSIGLLFVALLAGAALVWAIARPSRTGTAIAIIITAITMVWGRSLLGDIGWSGLVMLIVSIIGIGALWAFTVLDTIPRVRPSRP